MVLGTKTQAAICLMSGLGSDVCEWLVDAVPIRTASLTRPLLKQIERMHQ